MILTHRPIVRWPGVLTEHRTHSPFKAGYSRTLELLEKELRFLGAEGLVLQVAVREQDLKLDGGVRADARPEHPGVILSFESRFGPLSYPCDRFIDWHDNLRAIALGLEALRRVERYGITARGEQYSGWKALGSGIALPAGFETRDSAAQYMIEHAVDADGRRLYDLGDVDDGPGHGGGPFLTDAFRYASKRMHPDAGGNPADFARLVAARDRLLD